MENVLNDEIVHKNRILGRLPGSMCCFDLKSLVTNYVLHIILLMGL